MREKLGERRGETDGANGGERDNICRDGGKEKGKWREVGRWRRERGGGGIEKLGSKGQGGKEKGVGVDGGGSETERDDIQTERERKGGEERRRDGER